MIVCDVALNAAFAAICMVSSTPKNETTFRPLMVLVYAGCFPPVVCVAFLPFPLLSAQTDTPVDVVIEDESEASSHNDSPLMLLLSTKALA